MVCFTQSMNPTFFLILFTMWVCYAAENSLPFVTLDKRDLMCMVTFKSGVSSNYRMLSLDEGTNTLFIGGRSGVFGQSLADITKERFSPVIWPASADAKSSCESLPKFRDGKKCYNLIQMVLPMNRSTNRNLFICGTNALNPMNKFLTFNTKQYSLVANNEAQNPLCSFDPEDSISSLVVNENIFSTGRSDLQSKMSVMKSMPGRLIISNENTQEEHTNYVGAFQAEDMQGGLPSMQKVYFVSDEKADEPGVYGDYSPTVTQVCANDIGGKNILHNEWTSLLKIRLLCQTVAEHPLVFDLITHAVLDGNILYATFTTRHDTARANAVCSFKLTDIQRSFNQAEFWEEEQSSNSYRRVQAPDKNLRPGMCAHSGMLKTKSLASTSEDFPESHLAFMRGHHLVTDVIKPSYPDSSTSASAPPLLIKNGDKFTQIAVDKIKDLSGVSHSALFVATEKGVVLKYLYTTKASNEMDMIELAKYEVSKLPIASLKLSPKHSKLYIATDNAVHQVSTANCQSYTDTCSFCDPCRMCILSRDPYCAWSGQQCVSVRENRNDHDLLQDVTDGGAETQCKSLSTRSIQNSEVKVPEGATEILGHVVKNPVLAYYWSKIKDKNTKERIEENDKFRITKDGQLEISDFESAKDLSKYECEYTVHGTTVAKAVYSVVSSVFIPSVTAPPVVSSSTDKPETVSAITRLTTTGDYIVGINSTTETVTKQPVGYAGANSTIIIIVVILIIFVFVLISYLVYRFYHRGNFNINSKNEEESDKVDIEEAKQPINRDNSTNNNNAQMETDGISSNREETPLIVADNASSEINEEDNDRPLLRRVQGASKSCDILNMEDDVPFIDSTTPNGRFTPETDRREVSLEQSSSLREDGGRKRVPPHRTKSMPGSTLYVVFAGKKLACSTLQRNKQGNWVIEVPKQTGMSGMAGDEEDAVIEFINDPQAVDNSSSQFDDSSDRSSFLSGGKRGRPVDDARRAFFESGEPTVGYMTSTPTQFKPSKGQSSRSSLRSNGQNSSEELDSDSTVKSSSSTLRQENTPSLKHDPMKLRHHTHQNKTGATVHIPTATPTSDSIHSRSPVQDVARRLDKAVSDLSLDRSGSSGDEQLHGRDKDVTRKGHPKPPDSPSSSSSSEYRSARSSVISDPLHDQR